MTITSQRPAGARDQQKGTAGAPLLVRILVFVLPTVSAFGGLLPGIGPLFLARVLTALLAVVAFCLPRRLAGGRVAVLPVVAVWLMFLAVGLLGTSDQTLAIKMILPVLFGLATVAALEWIGPTAGVISSLLAGWVLAFLVTGVIGVHEALTGRHFSNYLNGSDLERVDIRLVASVFGNPNAFATFLVLVLPVLASVGLRSRSAGTSLASFGLVSLDFILILLTGSRLGAISATLVIAGMLVMVGFRRAVLMGGIGLGLGLAIVAFAGDRLVPLLPEKVGRSLGILTGQTSVAVDASYGTRVDLSSNGVWLLIQSKGLGLGPGSYEWNLTNAALPYPTDGVHSPHNAFLEIAVEAGVITLVALLAWLWRAGRLSRRNLASTDRIDRSLAVITLGGFIGALPMTIANSSWVTPTTNWCWLATIGAIAAHLAALERSGSAQ